MRTMMAIPRRKDTFRARAFGAFVRRLRDARGMTVRELARRTRIPHATWSRGERGLLDLRKWDYMIPLAEALRWPLAELAKYSGVEMPAGPTVAPRLVGKAGEPRLQVRASLTVSAGEALGAAAITEFENALSALYQESARREDPALLREVAVFARGLLAGSPKGRKRA